MQGKACRDEKKELLEKSCLIDAPDKTNNQNKKDHKKHKKEIRIMKEPGGKHVDQEEYKKDIKNPKSGTKKRRKGRKKYP